MMDAGMQGWSHAPEIPEILIFKKGKYAENVFTVLCCLKKKKHLHFLFFLVL